MRYIHSLNWNYRDYYPDWALDSLGTVSRRSTLPVGVLRG